MPWDPREDLAGCVLRQAESSESLQVTCESGDTWTEVAEVRAAAVSRVAFKNALSVCFWGCDGSCLLPPEASLSPTKDSSNPALEGKTRLIGFLCQHLAGSLMGAVNLRVSLVTQAPRYAKLLNDQL